MTIIPLVVSLVITGIASTSNVGAISRIGGRTLLVFFAMLAGATVLAIPLGIAAFSWLSRLVTVRPGFPPGAAEAAASLAAVPNPVGFWNWVQSLIPTNPIAAAANGAMLPLVVFTLAFAIALTRVPAEGRDSRAAVLSGTGRCDAGARRLDHLAGAGGCLRPDAQPRHAWRRRARGRDRLLYRRLFDCLHRVRPAAVSRRSRSRRACRCRCSRARRCPAQTIAFSSSSSIATLPALVRGAEGELQLPKDVTGFVLPLAVSVFKFAAPVSWTFGALFIAWFYQIPLGPMAYLTIAFTIVFLSFAGPGVPRGAFLMLAPMFLSIGLPLEGIGILIAVDAIPDIFATVSTPRAIWPRQFSSPGAAQPQRGYIHFRRHPYSPFQLSQGAHEHDAKEHDLPLVRQGRARGGALLRRHLSGQQSDRRSQGARRLSRAARRAMC